MDKKKTFASFMLFAALCSVKVFCQTGSLEVLPPGPLFVSSGSTVSINCTALTESERRVPLMWLHQTLLNGDGFKSLDPDRFQEDWTSTKTLTLTIKKIVVKDAGVYLCRPVSYDDTNLLREALVHLIVKKEDFGKKCAETQYTCPDGRCIFQRYRCDYVTDCADGADETDCDPDCRGMFRCDNGQCINQDYVCDKYESLDCRDGSDEKDCGRIKYGEDADDVATDPIIEHHNHGFHFNAIYSGVASVVGVACIGAIVVITLCRIQMKREAVRRRNTLLYSTGNSVTYNPHHLPPPLLSSQSRDNSNHHTLRLPWRHRAPLTAVHNPGHADNFQGQGHLLPHRCRGQTNVTVNVNLRVSPEGVPLFENDIVKPPPYTDREAPPPPLLEDGPPPPYTTLPYPQRVEGDLESQGLNGSDRATEEGVESGQETNNDRPSSNTVQTT